MKIIAHRAQDKEVPERFGVEIDVHWNGDWPIASHDPPGNRHSADFTEWVTANPCHVMYAINIKADGILDKVYQLCEKYIPGRYFVFDMSYPEQKVCERFSIPFAERVSEEEPWRGRSRIIWLDRWRWDNDYEYGRFPTDPLMRYREGGELVPTTGSVYVPKFSGEEKVEIYAVSPELHKLDCAPHWRRWWWREMERLGVTGICTDHYEEAEEFFGV